MVRLQTPSVWRNLHQVKLESMLKSKLQQICGAAQQHYKDETTHEEEGA